ncbi:M61 family metallopeptidase [Tellurirhabdus bombi]|uniref:M61 family metallopeptidase n=1 Tax=Tellurirhabdus bombi TaxID=2907205 RepID=UPI001F402F53|nr:PDZ domain-containing protein [Tellurirhabdus bombi]
MKKTSALFFLCLIWVVPILGWAGTAFPPGPSIDYTLSMPQPQTHFFEVEMRLSGIDAATNVKKNGYVDVKMPVWTPGSYLIREYAKNVEGFQATANGQPVRSEKIRKNTWRIYTNQEAISILYKVYAYELSVRTSFLDNSHGYLNGASIFLYVDPLRSIPHRVTINPYRDWKNIATGLKKVPNQANTFEASDYDILVDSPIEIGNHRTLSFTAANVPHTVAMYGETTYDEKKVAADMKKVCETATAVFGEHPCQDYTFLVHHTPTGGGGLEHLNSTTLQVRRDAYQKEGTYRNFLSLVAHEYFHLWNVKRLRPKALGPFDYENENYTTQLWVSEGITSFYQNYLLRKANFIEPDTYVKMVAREITDIENQPGIAVQSVAESSFDAWIKGYRPNENSVNSTISYYDKGSVLGSLLNLEILASTKGQKNLDDLMRFMYDEYFKKQKRGFTDNEFQQAAEKIAGRKLTDFFQKYVFSTAPIDYNYFFRPVGLELANMSGAKNDAYLGAITPTTRRADNRQIILAVRRDSPAWNDGLNVGDEILSINGSPVGNDLNAQIASFKPGDTIEVAVNRTGLRQTIKVKLSNNPLVNYQLLSVQNPTAEQKSLYAKWLYTVAK